MIRKLLPKAFSFHPLANHYSIAHSRNTQILTPLYLFSTDHPSKNHSEAINNLKDNDISGNNQEIGSSWQEESKDVTGELQKKENVFDKKAVKNKNQAISQIINRYWQSVKGKNFNVSVFSSCCKQLQSLYRQERHKQFLKCRQKLQGLIENISQATLKDAKLLDLLNMFDFVVFASRLQTINKILVVKQLNKVAFAIERYLTPLEKVSNQDLISIFVKICVIPSFPKLAEVTVHVHDRLVDLANSQQGLPMTVQQLYILMKSLSKKEYLLYADKRIVEIVLVILDERADEMNKDLRIQMVKALLDMRLWDNMADHRILSKADKLVKRALYGIQRGNSVLQMDYISQARVNDNAQHKEMVDIIFHRVIKQVEDSTNKFNPLRVICNCLKHLPKQNITQHERKIVTAYLAKRFKEWPLQRKHLLDSIIQLLQGGFFGKDVADLNAVMAQPDFDYYWVFAQMYSTQGLMVPIEILIQKIQYSSNISMQNNNNFLKMAYALSVQTKMHTQCEILITFHKKAIETINKYLWEINGVKWMTKIAVNQPKLVRHFYQEYGCLFAQRVKPSGQMLKQEQYLVEGQKSKLLHYLQFLFAVEEFDNCQSHGMLLKLSKEAITLPLSQQLKINNKRLNHKTFLLASVINLFQSLKLDFKGTEFWQIVRLLIKFQIGLGQGYDSFDQLYWSLCSTFAKSYSKITKQKIYELNFLFMLLLNIKRPKVNHSLHYRNFVKDLITSEGILTTQSKQSNLKAAISRAALAKNMFSEQYLPAIDRDMLSPEEQSLIKAMLGELLFQNVDHESLILLFRTQNPPQNLLHQFAPDILQFLSESSLLSLEKYLVFFSHASNPHSNKILIKMVKEYTNKLKVDESDVLAVINNLKNHLETVQNKMIVDLFDNTCKQLISNMACFSLSDHLQLMKDLNQQQISHEEYRQKLLNYAFEHKYRGTVVIDIAWEFYRQQHTLATEQHALNKEKLAVLANYSTFNPDNFMNLLVLHEDILPNTAQLLQFMLNNQSKLVSDSLVCRYLNDKYEIALKKAGSSEIWLHRASEEALKLLNALEISGVQVKGEELSDDKVYILNQKVILGFIEARGEKELWMVQKMLSHFYPKRQIVVCKQAEESSSLSKLLIEIERCLQLEDQSVQKIRDELHLL